MFAPLHGDGEHGGDGGRDGEVGDEGGDLAEHQPEHPVPAWRTATDYPEYLGLCDVIISIYSQDCYSTLQAVIKLHLYHVDEVECCVEECIQEVGEAQAEHQEVCHAPHFRVL